MKKNFLMRETKQLQNYQAVATDISDHSITVKLLEYNKKEGMIIQSEYSKTARSKYKQGMLKLKKLKKQEIFSVIRVDKVKGYIDLSKKGIKPTDIKEAEDNYEKGKKVQTFFYPLCDELEMNMEDIYKTIVWPLQADGEHIFDILHRAVFDFEGVMSSLNLSDKIKNKFKKELIRKFTPQPSKLKAIVELRSYDKQGVIKIKESINAGLLESTEEIPLKINLISPPLFSIQTTTLNKDMGVAAIKKCIERIKSILLESEGKFEEKEFDYDCNSTENNYEKLLEMNKKAIMEEDEDTEDEDDETMGKMDL